MIVERNQCEHRRYHYPFKSQAVHTLLLVEIVGGSPYAQRNEYAQLCVSADCDEIFKVFQSIFILR